MAKKLRVGVVFGGESGEHEVSLAGAASVLAAIDRVPMDEVDALIHRVLDEEQLSLLTLGAVSRRHLPRGLMRS